MKQYLRLLIVREGKEVLGKKGSNLWLLSLVLVATFASIAFSDGSQRYLKNRMEDPFTNWVSIAKATDNEMFNKFRDAIEESENRERFGYDAVQMDQLTNYNMRGIDNNHWYYLSVRCLEHLDTRLVKAILDKDNVVEGCTIDSALLSDKSLGFIISMDAAIRLGYDKENLPVFIHHMVNHAEGGDSLGLHLTDDGFYPVPFPVLAVVKRLPNNVDMIASNFFYDQRENNQQTYPFNFVENPEYLHELRFFVSNEISEEDFSIAVDNVIPQNYRSNYKLMEDLEIDNMHPWKNGKLYRIYLGNGKPSREICQKIANCISQKYPESQVRRIHKYEVMECPSPRGTFLSLDFNTLKHIREFEAFAKDYTVQLDMAQVASKENFEAVSSMAAILSAAMVIFSIICIIMFLVNMLQSYFQKVKRNIGTFKAFGMNANELIWVYIVILIAIVFVAVLVALFTTWCIQIILPILDIELAPGFGYLDLWNTTTYIATTVVVASTVATVVIVMTRILSRTPGDLIYDRN